MKSALAIMQNSTRLEQCGLMSPSQFHDKLDTGEYIGFTNGVYDTKRDVFMPRGRVGHNVLVSMTTKYAYVGPEDPRVERMCVEIMQYYATLFASDASDPDDVLVRTARMMVGSYLYPSNAAKKLHVYLGHEGNNGKSAFAEFLRLTLGDYYVTGNLSALTPGPRETLDVEIIRNYKALVCSFPEAQSSDRGRAVGGEGRSWRPCRPTAAVQRGAYARGGTPKKNPRFFFRGFLKTKKTQSSQSLHSPQSQGPQQSH
jgi:hypothetical protein